MGAGSDRLREVSRGGGGGWRGQVRDGRGQVRDGGGRSEGGEEGGGKGERGIAACFTSDILTTFCRSGQALPLSSAAFEQVSRQPAEISSWKSANKNETAALKNFNRLKTPKSHFETQRNCKHFYSFPESVFYIRRRINLLVNALRRRRLECGWGVI